MIPVILDTDIGIDVDDHWAVAMVLGSPGLDVKLITVSTGDVEYRANLLTQLLVEAGRTDVPIALAERTAVPDWQVPNAMPISAGLYDWHQYPGPTSLDGAGEIIRVIRASSHPVTIISICPVTTLAAALDRDPAIVDNSKVVSMSAHLRENVSMRSFNRKARLLLGHPEEPTQSEEPSDWEPMRDANVIGDGPAYQRLLDSSWDLTIAPSEVCFEAVMKGPVWNHFLESEDRVARMIVRDYREWVGSESNRPPETNFFDFSTDDRSSWLWDTVAVAMAYDNQFLKTETLNLAIDSNYVVRETQQGRPATVATSWLDLDGFLHDVSQRVLAASARVRF